MKVGLLGDLHIGSPHSKWRDAATLIKDIGSEMDAIILVGDITEERNPYPQTLALAKNDEDILKKRIQSALDEFLDKISSCLNKTVFLRGNHDAELINRCPLVEPYAVLRSKLGRIVALHGHQTSLTSYGLKLGWGVQSGRELKNNLHKEHSSGIKLESTDFIIMGHCHVAFNDAHAKVYSPGCWLGQYSNRNTGWHIIIDDEVTDSPELVIQMKREAGLPHDTRCVCGFDRLTNNDLLCPACHRELTPRCNRPQCNRPLRGEETRVCKIHSPEIRFYD